MDTRDTTTSTKSQRNIEIKFPALTYSVSNGIVTQMQHIDSEMSEARAALFQHDHEHLAEEIADVLVSSMTALRILERTYGIVVEDVMDKVFKKNRSRGYELPNQ